MTQAEDQNQSDDQSASEHESRAAHQNSTRPARTEAEDASVHDIKDPMAEAFALEREELKLPSDPTSEEYQNRLQELRKSFPGRRSFNFMVCDELARRGVTPTQTTVLAVSKWGTTSYVAADVADWYASLSRKLGRLHADIPVEVRVSANALFEQLWNLAGQEKTAPLRDRIEVLEKQLANANLVLAETTELATGSQARVDSLSAMLASAEARADELGARQKAAESALAQEQEKKSSEIADLTRQHELELESAALRLAEAQAEAIRRVDQAQARLDEVQRRHAEEIRARLEAETRIADEMIALRKDASLQIDRARQDAKDAAARANAAEQRVTQAHAVEANLRDQLAAAGIEAARRDMAIQAREAEIAALSASVIELRTKLATTPPPVPPKQRRAKPRGAS